MSKTLFGILYLLFSLSTLHADPEIATDFTGLWEAKRSFGPDASGNLMLIRNGQTWRAEIAGHSAPAIVDQKKIRFSLPGDAGSFEGKFDPKDGRVRGHWIQPPLMHSGFRFASPVELQQHGKDQWRGEVFPLANEFTLYLHVKRNPDGTFGALLRNPDRNLGIFYNVERLERQGDKIQLIGKFFRNKEETTLAEGIYHEEEGRLSIYFPGRGGTYDFTRAADDSASNFYARGKTKSAYTYSPPQKQDDGWQVASLQEAGLTVEPIKDFIENVVQAPVDSVHAPYIHGFLIARNGKLVFEEYFHGFHRDQPHDTRSASKSLTSVLVGAAIQKGVPIDAGTSVYSAIYGKKLPADIDPRKRSITLEHLLTMAPGFDCDDSNSKSLGNEDVMQEQEENRNWYDYTLNLPMVSDPGKNPAYCSGSPNLVGAVLSAATGRSLPDLFQELIARPLQIKKYYLDLQPTGEPYMGGGMSWMPRDFMKLGQLLLDEGMWNGSRIISKAWAQRSVAPLVPLRQKHYGYFWWVMDYPHKGRQVRAFFAAGNGGQIVMGIPEFDMVIAFYGGNYSDPVMFKIQDEFIPRYILPAIVN